MLACEPGGFATNPPQVQNAHGGQWRISAGFSVWHFVAKTAKNTRFPALK
ncbi:hypothetical protein PS691_00965 [Pseudomonas fluorescens]|uniref:Uncharacterized protein n=1 Tax=Pseudomonas fluorescens TaxID=294 RepID=A0A5E7AZ25_PSEFL|nr:hypothetical protein PS691_00965 [Pseudomonas fluorescens]